MLEQENAQVKSLLNRNTHVVGSPSHEPPVSLPERFDGTRSNLRSFVNQAKLLFELEPRRYPTDRMKVGLVGTLLTGVAAAWFCPLFESNSPLLDNFELFVKELQHTFGEHDRTVTAANKIRALKQGSKPVSVYATEFRLLASELGWDDRALTDQFRWGLSDPVKDLLLTFPLPDTLSDAIATAVKCDNRLRERESEKRNNFVRRSVYSGSEPNNGIAPMEIDAARQEKHTASTREEERTRRFELRLCLYCGAPGHQVRNCPKKSSTPLNSKARLH